MRIIAGEMRSRKLKAPEGMDTRPTADRVKEALFSILGSRVYGARVLDLYGGSGALALEAVSRGADSAVVCDYAGFSTYDSMYRAQGIFCVERAIVVTQGYHLSRALFIGKALDMDVYGAAADQETFNGQQARDLREIVARDKDLIKSFIKPEAKIMGDKLPIK